MVPLLAKNAVKIKCGFDNAVMTGNYECAYCLGILTYQLGYDEVTDYESITQLKKIIFDDNRDKTEKIEHDDISEENRNLIKIIRMLDDYEASDEIDEQMKKLYSVGFNDKMV